MTVISTAAPAGVLGPAALLALLAGLGFALAAIPSVRAGLAGFFRQVRQAPVTTAVVGPPPSDEVPASTQASTPALPLEEQARRAGFDYDAMYRVDPD